MTKDEDNWDALAEKQLASIKRDMRVSLEDAAVRATHKVMAELEEDITAPKMFGFGFATPKHEDYPMVFTGHYLIGGNPDDLEHGCWDTEQEALVNFALQFAKLAEDAQGNYLFVRKAPVVCKDVMFESNTVKWRMVGRFGIAKLKGTK